MSGHRLAGLCPASSASSRKATQLMMRSPTGCSEGSTSSPGSRRSRSARAADPSAPPGRHHNLRPRPAQQEPPGRSLHSERQMRTVAPGAPVHKYTVGGSLVRWPVTAAARRPTAVWTSATADWPGPSSRRPSSGRPGGWPAMPPHRRASLPQLTSSRWAEESHSRRDPRRRPGHRRLQQRAPHHRPGGLAWS